MYFAERIPVPRLDGEYVHIYQPQPAVYWGPNTRSFKNGQLYSEWITNDFSVIKDHNGLWHAIGITHPAPPGFRSAFDFSCVDLHESESQFYHTVFDGKLSQLLEGAQMEEKSIFFWASQRPDECPECYAPAVFRHGDLYRMIYTPVCMKMAVSPDLDQWETKGKLFDPMRGNFWMRDPYVYQEDGVFYIIYNDEEIIWVRKTEDFVHISEPEVLMPHMFSKKASMESPILFKREGWYYLLWSIYDGQNSCYDNRTFVFASRTLNGFHDAAPVAMLPGHAPEVVCEDGQWYIFSTHYPENGLSIAKLKWEILF